MDKRATVARTLIVALLFYAMPAAAQQTTPPATAPATAPAKKVFKEEELASLLAPIALYPDKVVTQILMASTYPLEVVIAARWVEENKKLTGEALAQAAMKQSWDPSVQGLVAMPDVLKMMDEKLDWTQKMGDAFLAQQKDVMDMIQKLRNQAQEAGNLKSDDHMKVTTQPPAATATASSSSTETKTEVIVIESTNPEVVYVPTYNPTTVYGYWGYPAYPPYYWPPPYGYPGYGFWWGMGVGITIGWWASGGCWGHHADWHGGDINIDNDINIGDGDRGDRVADREQNRGERQENRGDRQGDRQENRGDRQSDRQGDRDANRGGDRAGNRGEGGKWKHNADHRKGVAYRDNATANRFGGASQQRPAAGSRDAYRGRTNVGTSDLSRGSGSRNMGGASASTRDLGSSSGSMRSGSGSSAGTRDVGSRGSSASTRPSSSSRPSSTSRSSSSRSSSAFGGMSSGSRSRSASSRGGFSRGGGGGRRR